jgi:hypothetical protein
MNEAKVISLRPREQRAAEEILRKLDQTTGAETNFTVQEIMRLIWAIEQRAKRYGLSRD